MDEPRLGGQALVQKWGQVLDGGIDKIFAGWGDPQSPTLLPVFNLNKQISQQGSMLVYIWYPFKVPYSKMNLELINYSECSRCVFLKTKLLQQ